MSKVAVVGAGPVGLYLALLLGLAGHDVAVFEKEAEILKSPRAIAYYPVVLQDFEKAGILDDVLNEGYINTKGAAWRLPRSENSLTHIGPGDDPTKKAAQLGQDSLAYIIMSHIARLPNVQIRFSCELEAFEQIGYADVRTQFKDTRNGRILQHETNFLVGTDGGRSTTRKLMGLTLEGYTWSQFNIVAANIVYDLEALSTWGSANFIVDHDDWAVVAKTGKGPNWRIATGFSPQAGLTDEDWDEELALNKFREKLARIVPGPTDQARFVKISPYKMHQRCVPTYRKGNVMLAGDAAHLNNPVGGLGLTTGLMDASCLAQVLSQIAQGQDQENLLDWYASTRRQVFMEYTSPRSIANLERLYDTSEDTEVERQIFFKKLNERNKDFLKEMFEGEMGIATPLPSGAKL